MVLAEPLRVSPLIKVGMNKFLIFCSLQLNIFVDLQMDSPVGGYLVG